jgi:hypothetical protein
VAPDIFIIRLFRIVASEMRHLESETELFSNWRLRPDDWVRVVFSVETLMFAPGAFQGMAVSHGIEAVSRLLEHSDGSLQLLGRIGVNVPFDFQCCDKCVLRAPDLRQKGINRGRSGHSYDLSLLEIGREIGSQLFPLLLHLASCMNTAGRALTCVN